MADWFQENAPTKEAPKSSGDWFAQNTPAKKESTAVGDFAKGAWSKLNPVGMLRGMADTMESAYKDPAGAGEQFISEVLAHPYSAFTRGIEAAKAGKPEEALAHFSSALNPAGFVSEQSEVKASTPGQRAEGFGELVGTGAAAFLQGKGGELAGALKNKAVNAVKSAPANKLQTAADIAHMVASPGTAIPKMILQRGAAAIGDKLGGMAQEKLPPPLPATPPPLSSQPPPLPPPLPQNAATPPFLPQETAQAAAAPKPPAQPVLVPKKPTAEAPRYNPDALPKDPIKQGSDYTRGLIDMLERKRTLSGAQQELLQRLKSEVAPPAQTVPPLAQGPQETVIPFAKETPPADVFKAKARAARGENVEVLAKHLRDAGIDAEQVGIIPAAKWRDIGEALGLKLPKDMKATVKDVRERVFQMNKNRSETFQPSAELKKSLSRPGAADAARAFAEAMGQ